MINVCASLERNAALLPGKVAIRSGDRSLGYAELDAAANRVANGLRSLGIGRGDRVVLSCPNVPEFAVVYFGILKSGAVVVPISVLLRAPDIAYHLQDSQATAYFCFEGTDNCPTGREGRQGFERAGNCPHFFMIAADDSLPARIGDAKTLAMLMHGQSTDGSYVATDANDTAVVLYTSGTTGKPKGAELSHANIAMNALTCLALTRLSIHDVHLVALPLFHGLAQVAQMNAALMAGASLVLLPGPERPADFDAVAAFEAMRTHKVTILVGVPTLYVALLNLADDSRCDLATIGPDLRLGVCGGAPMPVEVMSRFEDRFGVAILEGYGLSEASPVATFNSVEFDRIPGCAGRAIWGTEVRVIGPTGAIVPAGAEGEIVIRGHNVMKGYFGRPEATAAAIRDGWLHTGDIGRMDEYGNLFVVDRVEDTISRGGRGVHPREIEDTLMTHDAVAMAAVVGVAHETLGVRLKAVVVCRPERSASVDALRDWCRQQLPEDKCPEIVEIVDALPMTATGKILKRELSRTP